MSCGQQGRQAYICLVGVLLVVEADADDHGYAGQRAQQLLDLVFPAGALEAALDVAVEDVDFDPSQVTGRLGLQVTVEGGALLIDEPHKSLERHLLLSMVVGFEALDRGLQRRCRADEVETPLARRGEETQLIYMGRSHRRASSLQSTHCVLRTYCIVHLCPHPAIGPKSECVLPKWRDWSTHSINRAD